MPKRMTRRTWLQYSAAAAAAPLFAGGAGAAKKSMDGEMVLIPEGPSLRGTDADQARKLAREYSLHPSWLSGEAPAEEVHLPAFRIDKFPVTNKDYAAFIADTGYAAPANWREGAFPAGFARHPVTFVNRDDAAAYAAWAGKRLPTEAEWEKAARGPEGLTWPWGNRFRPGACQWNQQGYHPTAPVDAHPEGASPYGVMDMVGNAAEWCADGPSEENAYIKGGCYLMTLLANLRPAMRTMSGRALNASGFHGFRCAQDV